MRAGVSADTRLLALLGDPVRHSLSPLLQNAAFAAAGVDGVYVALRCGADDVRDLLRTLARAGGGGNVTVPHKERAATVLDESTDAVRRTGACNTWWLEDGAIRGDNTDVVGCREAVGDLLDGTAEGARVLLLGAGGGARAALVALLDDGAAEVTMLNRTTERARAVARRIGADRVRVAENPSAVSGAAFDLVVNATSLGLDPADPPPLHLDDLGDVGAVMDMVYGSAGTPFVRGARARGIPAVDGGEMLVRQGAAAFERWWGRPAPREVMRAMLEEARVG